MEGLGKWVLSGLVTLVAGMAGCGSGAEGPEGLGTLALSSVGPSTVLAGTRLTVTGSGFVEPQLGEMTLTLSGKAGSAPVEWTAALETVDATVAECTVDAGLVADLVAAGQPFVGALTVSRRVFGYSGKDTADLSVTLYGARNIAPSFDGLGGQQFWIGDPVDVLGQGMLTSGEGQTVLVWTGTFKTVSPPLQKSLQSVAVPLDAQGRNTARFELSPSVFGVLPGVFSGSVHLENHVPSDPTIAPTQSAEIGGVSLSLEPTLLTAFSPSVVRRGQKVQVTGRGFLAQDPVGESATLLVLDGTFLTEDGKEVSYKGQDAMLLFPDTFDGNTGMEVVLRVTLDVDGKPAGLGLVPGVFTGAAYPELFYGGESVVGQGLDFSIQVARQLQIVYVKYLPSFDQAFYDFGMYEVREQVKQKVLERCNRDYAAFNVQFVAERPDDFEEYSVVELSGEDPNGANLLGLDNTTGKDNFNLRFNDVIGGKNAETEERGYYAYGGVFLKSFLLFSPSLGFARTQLASSRFDDIFGPFVPDLGGEPVEAGEAAGGERGAAIAEAVRVLGNLVGGTVVHEIGHSLGLAMVPGQEAEYHNIGDNPGWIMDAGNYRPFDERAEIDGKGPEVFAPYDFDYLQQILPKG